MPETLQITLPDGSGKEVPQGTTLSDFVRGQIGQGSQRRPFSRSSTARRWTCRGPLQHCGKLQVFKSKKEGLELIRHDAAAGREF